MYNQIVEVDGVGIISHCGLPMKHTETKGSCVYDQFIVAKDFEFITAEDLINCGCVDSISMKKRIVCSLLTLETKLCSECLTITCDRVEAMVLANNKRRHDDEIACGVYDAEYKNLSRSEKRALNIVEAIYEDPVVKRRMILKDDMAVLAMEKEARTDRVALEERAYDSKALESFKKNLYESVACKLKGELWKAFECSVKDCVNFESNFQMKRLGTPKGRREAMEFTDNLRGSLEASFDPTKRILAREFVEWFDFYDLRCDKRNDIPDLIEATRPPPCN